MDNRNRTTIVNWLLSGSIAGQRSRPQSKLWQRTGRLLLATIAVSASAATLPAVLNPSTAATTVSSEASNWDSTLKPLARKKRPLGSRGGICPLTPARLGEKADLWSLRPLFVWQGSVSQIAIRPVGKSDLLWRYTNPSNTTQPYSRVLYDGTPLQPGQTYEWLIFDQFAEPSAEPTLTLRFHVIDMATRSTITRQLQILEIDLQKKGATADAIAQQRTKFFVDRQLSADALQTIFAVKTPSVQLKQVIQNLPTQLCKAAGS